MRSNQGADRVSNKLTSHHTTDPAVLKAEWTRAGVEIQSCSPVRERRHHHAFPPAALTRQLKVKEYFMWYQQDCQCQSIDLSTRTLLLES